MATLELYDRLFSPIALPAGVTVTPRRWSARAPGGPDRATIELSGPKEALWQVLQWLRFGVKIRNDAGALVWWGFVHEATVNADGARMGLSLEGMHNRIKVLYSYDDEAGEPHDADTGWVAFSAGVTEYGAKERRHSAGDTTSAAAAALAARLLATERAPVATARSNDDEDASATIECRGWWDTLAWQYYADATGRIVADTDDAEQTLGWVLTSTAIAFTRTRQISHNGNALAALRTGDLIRVTGSASNNTIYFVKTPPDKDATESYTSTTIWFDAVDDIMDTAEQGLGFIKTDDLILTAGSTLNNGYDVVDGAQASHVTVDSGYGGTIGSYGVGDSVTITRCLTAVMDTTGIVREMPGASTTLTLAGQWVLMRFMPDAAWPALEVMIKIKKTGAPSDNVRVSIYDATGGSGLPGSLLSYGDLAAANIKTKMTWASVTMGSAVNLTAATYYWVALTRTGTPNADNFYTVAVDESFTAPTNVLKIYDGSGYVERTPNADGVLQVWGRKDNGLQMASMGAAASLIARTDVQVTTGLVTRHYRDGTQTIQDEVIALLDAGTATGGGLYAYVNQDRTLIVQAEATSATDTDLLASANGLTYPSGQRIEAGRVPAGAWARMAQMPQGEGVSALGAMYLESVEWDEVRQKWTWEPRGLPDVAAIWALRNG